MGESSWFLRVSFSGFPSVPSRLAFRPEIAAAAPSSVGGSSKPIGSGLRVARRKKWHRALRVSRRPYRFAKWSVISCQGCRALRIRRISATWSRNGLRQAFGLSRIAYHIDTDRRLRHEQVKSEYVRRYVTVTMTCCDIV